MPCRASPDRSCQDGRSYSNIVGLPLYETIALLGGEGFPIRFGWLNAS